MVKLGMVTWVDILARVDLLVVGGGIAGVAAACAAAEQGRSVCLMERRTYLGAEVTASSRYWLQPKAHEELGLVFGWDGDFVVPGAGNAEEWPIVPDRFKLALEERLLAARVQLVYSVRPVGVERQGELWHVAVGGKFGVRSIYCQAIVDATEQADFARSLGRCEARHEGSIEAWRTLELTGVDLSGLQPAGAAWRVHRGHASDQGHLLLEHSVTVTPSPGLTWLNQAEHQARLTTMALARGLREAHPAFKSARVVGTAHQLSLPSIWRVTDLPLGILIAGPCSGSITNCHLDLGSLARLGWGIGEQACAGHDGSSNHLAALTLPPYPVELRQVDVLVIGGGTSGASASVGAARHGATTLLIEMNPGLGGTGTMGGVDSYWFGRRGGFNSQISRRVADEHAWMQWSGNKWNIEGKMTALLKIVHEAGVGLLTSAQLVRVLTAADGRVTGALIALPDGLMEVTAAVTVDATGDGDVAVMAGAEHVYGSDREGVTMWYSMIPFLRPGIAKNNFTSTVDVGDPVDYTRAILSARRRLPGHDHGSYVAPRESRHITGEVRISLTDILTMKSWPDLVNLHLSNHDIKGHNTSDWLRMGLIPPNLEVEIPYRALVPVHVDGLLITGKAISATHDALPPIRMQADLENLGYVCGVAAAMAKARGITPRDLPVRDLQLALVKEGILPAEVPDRELPAKPHRSEAEMRQ